MRRIPTAGKRQSPERKEVRIWLKRVQYPGARDETASIWGGFTP
jgi:hypothetical protein